MITREKPPALAALKKALVRAVTRYGHDFTCSARMGMEGDCTCGWVEVRELAKRCAPPSLESDR